MNDTITLDKVEAQLSFFNKMYDVIRLVDPVKKKVLEYRCLDRVETGDICHSYWKDGKVCDNCISIRAYANNKCFHKLEQTASDILLVTAIPIDNVEVPTVLELLKKTTETMMIGSGNYSDGHLMKNVILELNDLAIKDELTGLYNRRYVDERLPADIIKAKLEGSPLSVVFVDVDNLKEINDKYGHITGDKAIMKITDSFLGSIRTDLDWVARYGGDEFIIFLNNTSSEKAYHIAERIRSKISSLVLSEDEDIKTTISLGVYTMQEALLSPDELISMADKRMYQAKQQGKNRIILIGSQDE
jgi:diguanylate cyclase (GGDEF) domain